LVRQRVPGGLRYSLNVDNQKRLLRVATHADFVDEKISNSLMADSQLFNARILRAEGLTLYGDARVDHGAARQTSLASLPCRFDACRVCPGR
jgi:hypothetical protein